MADLNALIAQGAQFNVPDPMNQFAKISQIQQAQQQNQLNRLKMDEYARALQEQEGVRNYLASRPDLSTSEGQAGLLGFGKTGLEYGKALSEQQTAALARQKTSADLVDAKLKQSRQFLENVSTPEQYIAWHEGNHADPILGPALAQRGVTADTARAQIEAALQQPGGFEKLLNQSKLGVEKFAELNKPQLSTTDIGGQVVSRTFQPMTGTLTTIGAENKTMAPGERERLANDATRIKQEGARIGLEGRRVAVMEENARRDADPTFQQRMGAAKATGEALAKGDVAAQQALPKIINRAEEGMRLIDELVGKRDEKGQLLKGQKPHPGFQDAVGATWLPGARFVPGTDAAGFMSRFEQVKGSSFLEAFEALKGGGAITEKEGEKGTSAINRMSTSTDEKEFIRAAMDLQEIIRKGVESAQSRAFRAGGAAKAAAKPAASPNIDALLEKYK